MRVKYLIDADLPRALFQGLIRRSAAIDVLRVQQVGLGDAPDPEILNWAAAERRITVSRDKSTMRQFAARRMEEGKFMPGLLLVRPDYVRRHGYGLREVIDELILIAEVREAEEWYNLIQFIPFLNS